MSFIKKTYEIFRTSPVLRTLVAIVVAIALMLIVAHYLMQLGTRHGSRCSVPDFTGISIGDAEHLAKKHDLEIIVNDSLYVPVYDGGIVLEQNPNAEVAVKPGRKIYVTINSFAQKSVKIPYVTGYSLRQAKNNLEIAGLEIAELIYQSDMATNNVLEERFRDRVITRNDNIEAEAGSGITLVVGVSAESGAVSVPKVIGFPLKEAKSRLWEVGLNVGRVIFDEDIEVLDRKNARVYLQSPQQNKVLSLGQRVDLHLTLDPEKIEKQSAASDRAARRLEAERELREAQITDSLMIIEEAYKAERRAADSLAAVARGEQYVPEGEVITPIEEPAATDPETTFFE
ncbi:MAG: PASTA domain-containing protein [Rikenellaceae bacterium]|jgi:beta-lactam-binding protein with PASTA domain|nr:PASTA domain-containing protein [Rikenellaceae bacterium]MBQ5853562.1 PASTA domain-containing protein [Rikenellaceae bacterium]